MPQKLIAVDTNVAINHPEVLKKEGLVVTSTLLRELEKLEMNSDKYGERSYKAREARRFIKANKSRFHMDLKDYVWTRSDDFDTSYEDNRLLECCIQNNFGLLTMDGLLAEKAMMYDVEWLDVENELKTEDGGYTGYKEVKMSDQQIKDIYSGDLQGNPYGLVVNQYLVAVDSEGKDIDAWRYDGEYYLPLAGRKSLKTRMFGDFKPKDTYQRIAFDTMTNNQVSVIGGAAGVGKTAICVNYEMQQLENGKIDRIIYFVNPIATKNAVKLGFYTGSKDEKLLDSSIGHMLSSKFGDKSYVKGMIERGEILLLPFSDIRGFDTTGEKKSIVHILEAQNLDVELMKLAIQRVDDNTKLLIDGDYLTQVDDRAFEGANNGMRRLSEIFRGDEVYGEVRLPNIYRSRIATKAEEM